MKSWNEIRRSVLVKIKHDIMLWSALGLLALAIAMGALYPAGHDYRAVQAKCLAAQGEKLYWLLDGDSRNPEAPDMNYPSCSNTSQLAEYLAGAYGTTEHAAIEIDDVWTIAVSLSGDCVETFPVIVSANFDPRLLETAPDDDMPLPVGRKSGACLSMLDDKAIVLVRKNGKAEIVSAKYCTRKNILGTSCDAKCSATYLTPCGKMQINLGKCQ